MGRQLVAVNLDRESAKAVDEDVNGCSERPCVIVERPLPTRSGGEVRNDGRIAGLHHEDGGITASLVHRLVTFEDFTFGKRVCCVTSGVD